MKKVIYKLSILIILFGLTKNIQAQRTTHDLVSASQTPAEVKSLFLDLSWDDENEIIALAPHLINIEEIAISDLTNNNIHVLRLFPQIKSIVFTESEEFSFSQVLEIFSEMQEIESISFNSCNIESFPIELSKLPKLKRLEINNSTFSDFSSIIPLINSSIMLTNIYLQNNEISSFPNNFSSLNKKIKVLDLSNNYIEFVNQNFSEIRIDTLILLGNEIADTLSVRNNLKNAKTILFEDLNPISLKEEIIPLFDSIAIEAKEEQDFDYLSIGSFKTENTTMKVFSSAYKLYPIYFNIAPVDSMYFEERFKSLDYINGFNVYSLRKHLGQSESFLKSRISKPIGFEVKKDKQNGIYVVVKSYSSDYKELNVYKTTKWKTNEPISFKELRKFLCGTKKKPKRWNDVKIETENNFFNYTFILKDDTAFIELQMTPLPEITEKESYPSERHIKALKLRHQRYQNVRNQRAKAFNKEIVKEKRNFEKSQHKRWLDFQNLHMSSEERKLTKSEWLDYYQKVLNNEKNILLNSDLNFSNFKTLLEADGYFFNRMWLRSDSPFAFVRCKFVNHEGFLLAVKKIIIINKESKIFSVQNGNKTNKFHNIAINFIGNFSLVIETIDGRMGFVNQESINSLDLNNKTNLLNCTIINPKIGTLSQIYNNLEL
jgi:hypothetical protein